ncbi:CsiV family protein [Moritella sp. F3]|uniref:CsiV family protein n=1 Tax=Moritella sp. F3 TaxID=2718882 RepID=UPI0018E1C721|nr:CsiV family protein [Moritella sp. F3]GIC79173.1 hypothetical protein FMO001_39000 [Moritella sp. F1]GIC83477.1 hypothetical protein FMO003_37570 [Moritella sp. F3]
MKKSLISLLVGLSVGSSFAVSAAEEERWFEVEVILFDRNIDPAKVIEHWDPSLYPTYSKENKDPMALFINDINLINKNSHDANNADTLNKAITTGLQPTLIDDSETLPVFGDDSDSTRFATPDIDNDIISSTRVVIDGANLNSKAQDPALQIVPANELQLTEQFKALNDHANYNVVLHTAWRMQPKDRTQAIPIRLFAGQNYQQQYKQNGDAILNQAAPLVAGIVPATIASDDSIADNSQIIDLDNATSISDAIALQDAGTSVDAKAVLDLSKTTLPVAAIDEAATQVWKIDGELTIYLEHYLYAKTNLFVRKEGSKVIPARQVGEQQALESDVAVNAENIDLLERLGIHLEPKQSDHNKAIISADATLEYDNDFVVDEVAENTEGELNNEITTMDAAVDKAPQGKVVPFLHSYPMQQLRVIRSGEIHYLDHPMFGMLIQIRKYEPPMPKDTIDTAQ